MRPVHEPREKGQLYTFALLDLWNVNISMQWFCGLSFPLFFSLFLFYPCFFSNSVGLFAMTFFFSYCLHPSHLLVQFSRSLSLSTLILESSPSIPHIFFSASLLLSVTDRTEQNRTELNSRGSLFSHCVSMSYCIKKGKGVMAQTAWIQAGNKL